MVRLRGTRLFASFGKFYAKVCSLHTKNTENQVEYSRDCISGKNAQSHCTQANSKYEIIGQFRTTIPVENYEMDVDLNMPDEKKTLAPSGAPDAAVQRERIAAALQSREPGESLYEMTLRLLRRLNNPVFRRKSGELNEAAFYKYARIEKNTWSNIRLGSTVPRKETVLKLVIALQLSEAEASALLAKASWSFSDTDPRDAVILACIDVGCYDIETVYDTLEEYAHSDPNQPRRFKNIY